MWILWKNIQINYQCRKTYHSLSFRNKAFSCEFCGKRFISTIIVEIHIIHLVSFISNDLFKRLVGKFPVFWAVAYFFLKILDSRCLFYIVNFEKLHHFYRYFCNTWIFIFEASINNILRLKKGILVGTNTKCCHYSFILDFKLLKCCLKFSAKN